MATDLMLHRGARLATREELDQIEAPPPTATWYPLRHATVLDRVMETLDGAGFQIVRSQFAVAQQNHRFFGTLDLTTGIAEGITLTVGVRNSTDQSFPIGFAVGSRVFVCDNLAFSSEIVVARKHTRFGELRFNEAICKAVQSLHQYQDVAAKRIAWMQTAALSDDQANSLMLQAAEKEIVGWRALPKVIDQWREPRFDEFRDRTSWSLFNAFTQVLKDRQQTQPARAAHETIRLQKLLAPEVIDVPSITV